MKRLLKSSRELNFVELLDINGGYSGSSGGNSGDGSKSGYSYNYSTSNSSKTSSYSSSYSGSSSGSSSKSKKKSNDDLYRYNEERILIIDGRAYSSTSGFIPTPETETATVEKKPGDGIVLPKGETDDLKLPNLTDDPIQHNQHLKDILSDTALAIKIQNIIKEDIKKNEIVYGKDGKMCDNYVQSLLAKCGIDYTQYFAGDAEKFTVTDHIENLDRNKSYDSSTLDKCGTYVVFMCGDKKLSDGTLAEYSPHCGILTIDGSGNMWLTDNSSSNKKLADKSDPGGLGVTYANSISEMEGKFGYSTFYYQKVK